MRNTSSSGEYVRSAANQFVQAGLKVYRETRGEGSNKCLVIKPRSEHFSVPVCPFMRKCDAAINQVLGEAFG